MIGARAHRTEDIRFLTGSGRYGDDISLPGETFAAFVLSPEPAGRIVRLDCSAARAMPGVLGVYTSADLDANGIGGLPCAYARGVDLRRIDGAPMFTPPRSLLVRDRVRFVGDLVAMVVARTAMEARDAAEAVELAVEAARFVLTPDAAATEGAPAVWPDCPDNAGFAFSLGDHDRAAEILAEAPHVAHVAVPFTRIAPSAIEPRTALGVFDEESGRLTLHCGTQVPHLVRQILAADVFRCAPEAVRVVTPDIGGSFGMRSNLFPEMALVLWAARRTRHPVRWTGTRSAAFLSDDMGRDVTMSAALALDRKGTFLALSVSSVAALGAYLSTFGPLPATSNLGGLAGVYRTPVIAAKVTGVFTNVPPTSPYRGAGRPEAVTVIEMAIDEAPRRFGFDRIELRRRNVVTAAEMPFRTGLTYIYDSGDFPRSMEMALALADAAGFEDRRAEASARGHLRGLGVVNAIEAAAGRADEEVTLAIAADGTAELLTGSVNQGQGHETVLAQIVANYLPVPHGAVAVVSGDTDRVRYGVGSFASRTVVLAGSATVEAARTAAAKARAVAARLMAADLHRVMADGDRFHHAGTNHTVSFADVAAFAEAGELRAAARMGSPGGPVFPNGCHVCEVEVDRDTGALRIVAYTVVHDVGTAINPMIVEGQIHGGIAQGAAQAVSERMVYDPDTGQPLTGSFMDYALPRASDLTSFSVGHNPQPTPTNPLGAKGAGEAGTVGALPAVMAAVSDALASAGAGPAEMPATPERLWRLLRAVGPTLTEPARCERGDAGSDRGGLVPAA